MGRKKKDHSIGKSIIKDRFGPRKRVTTEDSFLHTSELQDGYDWGRLNLQSVTEQSNLDDFLATAELAGTEFTAERLNVKIVNPLSGSGLPSSEEMRLTAAAEDEHRKLLKIPRRPSWDETTTAEELDLKERTSFLEWRRGLAQLQEKEHLTLTPFERNLDFWRQLWRVIERSDVIVQIVDARNPLLFRCEDLEEYVRECGDGNKTNVLLINKADLLTHEQRVTWAHYFDKQGTTAVFWSATQEAKRCEEEAKQAEDIEDEEEDEEEEEEKEEEEEEEEELTEGIDHGNEEVLESDTSVENAKDAGSEKVTKNETDLTTSTSMEAPTTTTTTSSTTTTTTTTTTRRGSCEGTSAGTDPEAVEDVSERLQLIGTTPAAEDSCTDAVSDGGEGTEGVASEVGQRQSAHSRTPYNSPSLLTGEELINILRSTHQGATYTAGVTTLGLVGYPNVGKSSTINAILRAKKVPVSATPGRTKHFQTHYVQEDTMLCDCPGLVMPTFVSTKADMVVSGILPIDQMRDYIPPTTLVCHRIPREVLESTYGILLPPPGEGEPEDRPPTAMELLSSYGYMRGFMTHKGIPDYPRAARHILKDYVNGKLLYAHPPLGISPEEFQSAAPPQKMVKTATTSHTPKDKKAPEFTNFVDKQFFEKPQAKIGIRGVKGWTGAPCSSNPLASSQGKKHFKKGKKEKLRRLHGHMDN